jgi:hypothetical protein
MALPRNPPGGAETAMLKPIDFSLNPNLAATSGLVDYPGLALPGPWRFSFTYRVLRQRHRATATASHQTD